jgi:hypothetical protein
MRNNRRDDEPMPVICPTRQIFSLPSNRRMTSRKKHAPDGLDLV